MSTKYIVQLDGKQHIIEASSMDDAANTILNLYRILTAAPRVTPLSVFKSVHPNEVIIEQQVIISDSAQQTTLNTVRM